jgi:hypothetical protein
MCAGRVSCSCSTSGTRRINLVAHPVIKMQVLIMWVKEMVTYDLIFVLFLFCVVCSTLTVSRVCPFLMK